MLVSGRIVAINNVCFFILISFCSVNISGNQQCGNIVTRVRGGKLTGKIVGGYEVGYYKYPWFAAMQIDDETYCGSALIGPNYLITAAHCYDDYIGKKKLEDVFTIKMGLYNNCKKEPTQKKFKIAKVIIHEKYNNNKPYYDIALLKLAGNTTAFEPICLPPKNADQESEGWIIGLGSLVDEGGPNDFPCTLHEGRILLYDTKTCKSMMAKLTNSPSELKYINSICAGYKSGGVDSCQGDSGGPLMTVNSQTNKWQTVGITSFGYGCAVKDQMGVYTDVSKYLDWIETKSGIKAADEYSENNDNNVPNNDGNNNSQVPLSPNYLADTFNAIYDHVMDNPHAPKEIVIRFKNKQKNKQQKQRTKSKSKTNQQHLQGKSAAHK